ncbi:MAG: sigma-70 family RNA polymerase sigma factor [Bacteroidales bacterium]|nr:sigma-70 family RNA polymerase sigma factor [Bacteroidales bacterium]
MSQQDRLQKLSERYLDLFSLAMSIVQNSDDARDALQEAIATTLARPFTRDPYAFCRHALRNNCVDILRHRRRLAPIRDIMKLTSETYPDEAAKEAWQLKDELPEQLRVMMELHDVEGYTYSDLAALTGRSISSIKRDIAYAHDKMRRMINNKNEK